MRPDRSPRSPGNALPESWRPQPRGGSACTMATPGQSQRAGSASRSSSATRPRSWTTMTASCSTTPSNPVTRPTPHNSHRPSNGSSAVPAASRARSPPTAGYGEKSVEDDPHALGVRNVVIPRKGRPRQARRAEEHRSALRRTVKWRTGSEGRISSLKRGYGWDRTRIDSTEGARTWTGHRHPRPQPGQDQLTGRVRQRNRRSTPNHAGPKPATPIRSRSSSGRSSYPTRPRRPTSSWRADGGGVRRGGCRAGALRVGSGSQADDPRRARRAGHLAAGCRATGGSVQTGH